MPADEVHDRKRVARAEPEPEPAAPAETNPPEASLGAPAEVADDAVKICCICGLDVSQQKRHRDRAGRYWCAHCHGFDPAGGKTPGANAGTVPCPNCGRETRQNTMVEEGAEKVCSPCHQLFLAEAEPRRLHKAAVTADPELAIRALILKLEKGFLGLAAAAVLVTLYHFHLLYVRPMDWVPFEGALYCIVALSLLLGIVIGIQYLRMMFRQRAREADYDRMIQAAANQILAIDEENHAMGVSESPEPLRRRVERAIARVEAYAGQNVIGAGDIIKALAEHPDPSPLIQFLLAHRPNTNDTVARNREIATISYIQGDMAIATSAVNAILIRLQFDQEAMTRQALIAFRVGELEQAKKMFKRVVYMAREKKNEIDLAEAYCNLGMLHMMLSEFDDADVRYSQAMQIYNRLSKEDGQADCLMNLGLIAYRTKKSADAEPHFRKAMAINKRYKRREGLAICCSLLGVILVEKEPPELNESEKLLNRAAQLNLELGRPGGVAAAYGNLGLVRVKRGDLKGARDLFLKAQSIYQRINRPKMMAKIQGMLKTVGTLSAAKAAAK